MQATLERRLIYDNIANEFLVLQDLLDESEGELTPEIQTALERFEHNLNESAEGCCKVIAEFEGQAVALHNEIQRLCIKKQSRERAAERIKEFLKARLEFVGVKKLDAGTFTISVCRNSQPTVNFAGGDIPEPFQRIKIELDKKKVADAWKAGAELPEFDVQQGTHLRIR